MTPTQPTEPKQTDRFLGRTLNHLTMVYEFEDGSGCIPAEIREDALSAVAGWSVRNPHLGNFLPFFGTIWAWKDRVK